jgi:hypothetical protein
MNKTIRTKETKAETAIVRWRESVAAAAAELLDEKVP